MEELLQRFFGNLAGRLDGPLHFRILIQPLMAALFAAVDGIGDARLGRPAWFWALLSNADHRRDLLKDGWKHFGKIFIIAAVLDVIYQVKVFGAVYPGEVVLVALLLAVLPYVLIRGPANRIAGKFERKHQTGK